MRRSSKNTGCGRVKRTEVCDTKSAVGELSANGLGLVVVSDSDEERGNKIDAGAAPSRWKAVSYSL
jgi:hypothetical protein